MHEASLVESMLRIALAEVRDFQDRHPDLPEPRIREIACEAGLLTCVDEDTLRACLEIFAEDTLAEGALFTLRIVPLACSCKSCGQQFLLAKRRFICPHCNSDNIKFSGGTGFTIQSIEIDCGEKAE